MTLENSRIRLEIAKKANNPEEIKLWEDRIASKLANPKYAHLKEEPKEEKKETKSKVKK